MAMHRQAHALDAAHMTAQISKDLRKLIRHRIADGIGNVDGGRTGVDDRLDHLRQKVQFGA